MKTELVSHHMMIERNGDLEVNIDGVVHFTTDSSYGEDADGNRGVSRIVVEDIEDVLACDVEGEVVELTEIEQAQAEEILIEKFLEG